MSQPEPSPSSTPENVQAIFGQAVLTGLAALLLLALSFSFFVWRQNTELNNALMQMTEQQKSAEEFLKFHDLLVQDLAAQAQHNPEIAQILARQGIGIRPQSGIPPIGGAPTMPPPQPGR